MGSYRKRCFSLSLLIIIILHGSVLLLKERRSSKSNGKSVRQLPEHNYLQVFLTAVHSNGNDTNRISTTPSPHSSVFETGYGSTEYLSSSSPPPPSQLSQRSIYLSMRFEKADRHFWNAFNKTVSCSSKHLKRTGGKGESHLNDGGKWTCGLSRIGNTADACNSSKPCALFSFGVNKNSYFEAKVLKETCCKVFAYDPTDVEIGKPLSPNNTRVKFQQLAVGKKDNNRTRKFKTLMEDNGYDWVDVVKMDIKGGEYDALGSIFNEFEVVPIGMLLVVFHADKPSKILETFDILERKGMRLYYSKGNPYYPDYACEYSFLNVNAKYNFLGELINTD